jgi:sugar lactone lactonase YvrE
MKRRAQRNAQSGVFYVSGIRMVDERPLLGTLPGTSKKHTMINTTFLRSLLAAATLAALPFGTTTLRGATGDILETNDGNVLRFKTLGGTPTTFSPGFANPKGIVFDGNGHVYVADAGKNSIIALSLPDGNGITYATGLNAPNGLAFDTAGNLYVSEAGSGNIIMFAPDRTKTTFATNAGAPSGMVFDSSGNLFVADFSGGKIYKYTPSATQSTFVTGVDHPAGLAMDSSGNLFVAESGTGSILKFAPDATKTVFVTGAARPYGIAFDTSGNLIVADNGAGATLRYSPEALKSVIFQSNFNTPQFLAIEPAQHQLLNISTRGFIRGGNDVLIAGFVVGGNGPVGTSILVRALGPSLSAFGISDPLADPVIELRDASGTLLASNNDWKDTQQTAISGTPLAPTNDRESAILTSLHGGAFTAIVGSATGTSGTVVVEVYNLPSGF